MGVALREGVTSLHLVSKDLRKEKLVTEILVKKVKKVILDFSNLPKYFTDIKSDPLYRKEYMIPLRFYISDDYEELSKNSEDEVNFIDQKLKVKCVSKEPEIFVAEIIQKNVDKGKQLYYDYDNECKVTIRNIPFENVNFILKFFFYVIFFENIFQEIPQNLHLEILLESPGSGKEEKNIYETIKEIPFTSSFKIKEEISQIILKKENKTYYLDLQDGKELDIEVDDPKQLIAHIEQGEDRKYKLKIFVPHTVRENFENKFVKITNKLTGQFIKINVNYIETEENKNGYFLGLFSRDNIVDFVTIFIIGVVIYILVYHNFSNEVK